MTTQEKQQPPCEAEHTPFKMICKSNGTSQYYECMHCGYIDFSEAIDSAKREGAIEELKKTDDVFSAMHQGTPGAGWVHYGEFGEYIDDRIAQLEQSGEDK